MPREVDVAVIGAGAAGLSAALYSARYGFRTLVVAKESGGMANEAAHVENYPGITSISGAELMKKFAEQAKKSGAEILQEEVADIKRVGKKFEMVTDKNKKFDAKAIILALGTEKRKLNVKGEEKFLGKGVSYCATCDAPLFKNKVVAIIGGRNSAAMAALLLVKYAKKVYIVYRKNQLRCDYALEGKIKKDKKIKIFFDANPLQIGGKEIVETLLLEKKAKKEKLKVDGIFIEIGCVPSISLAKRLGIKIDRMGYIVVDEEMQTSREGIFAAGDVTSKKLKQIITAAGDGATAAFSAFRFLKGHD